MGDLLFVLGVFAACGGMLWLSKRIEPHFVSKDGRRIMCMSQSVPRNAVDDFGKLRETRCTINGDGTVTISRRERARRTEQCCRVVGRVAQEHPKRVQYLLSPCTPTADSTDTILRLPSSSSALATLDSIATRKA